LCAPGEGIDDVVAIGPSAPVARRPLYENVCIEAVGVELPPHRVSSRALEDELLPTYQRLGIPAGCIETLVGIMARRFWDEGTTIASAAALAARQVYRERPELLGRTGLVVSTSVCKDYLEPSVAALVRGQLALSPECEALDLGNACLGFMNGMDLAATWIEGGRIECALVVAAESSRFVVQETVRRLLAPASTKADYLEALPTLTLGSGAVAMLLVHRDLASHPARRVRGAVSLGDPASSTICLGTPGWMKTDATALLKNGVALAERTWAKAQERFGWTRENIAQLVCHQVGATHLATLATRLDLDLQRAFLTYPELGNIGPAAVPITLRLAVDDGRVRSGDRVALMGIGSGLSCMMMEVVW
jgi:3-oxoacyl-[acyl-carrier-protein] synthase-3